MVERWATRGPSRSRSKLTSTARAGTAGRVLEDRKAAHKSLCSFAARREAQADAERFVEKLNPTWRDQERT
jgi:hypothetical protein